MNLDDDFFEYSDEAAEEDFVSQDFTADDFIFPEEDSKTPDPNRKKNIRTAVIVIAVLMVCCVGFLVTGWFVGDYVVEFLGY